ncbi:hypothetical protein KI387_025591, partial [Taxus chinensis]
MAEVKEEIFAKDLEVIVDAEEGVTSPMGLVTIVDLLNTTSANVWIFYSDHGAERST